MKKMIELVLAVIFIASLFGCSNTAQNMATQSASALNSDAPERMNYTRDNAVAAFLKNKDSSRYEAIDCVLVEDDKIPTLKAVVSYCDRTIDNSCNLAFIFGDASREICFAANETEGARTYEIADNSRLAYIGDGAVATSIRKIDTGEILDFTVSFSYDASIATSNFKIISCKHT